MRHGSTTFDGSKNSSINVTVNSSQTADKLTSAKTISLTNEVTGSASFDGSSNISINATVTRTTYISSSAPSNSVGKNGDIWYQWI